MTVNVPYDHRWSCGTPIKDDAASPTPGTPITPWQFAQPEGRKPSSTSHRSHSDKPVW